MSNISIFGSGVGGGLTVGTTPIVGSTGAILWDDAGVLQEVTIGANLTFSGGTLSATGGTGAPSPPVNSVQYDNAGSFGGAAHFSISSGNPNVADGFPYMLGGFNYLSEGGGDLSCIAIGISIGTIGIPGDGNTNIAIGQQSFGNASITSTGANNIGMGFQSLWSLTSGNGNVCLGRTSGKLLTSGAMNLAVGTGALSAETAGSFNVAIGQNALFSSVGANGNFALGGSAMVNCTAPQNCVAVGGNALTGAAALSECVAIGSQALQNCTGNLNVGIGALAGVNITSGTDNTLVGWRTAKNMQTTSSGNTWIGEYEGSSIVYTNTLALSYGGFGGALLIDFAITNTNTITLHQPPTLPGYAVGSLPTSPVGTMAYVTDGTAGLVNGNVVTGGHATPYLVWFNGTNWTVVGE